MTNREHQIYALLITGLSAKQIAGVLKISVPSILQYLHAMRAHYNAKSTAQLVYLITLSERKEDHA